jgi:hypothetical protein
MGADKVFIVSEVIYFIMKAHNLELAPGKVQVLLFPVRGTIVGCIRRFHFDLLFPVRLDMINLAALTSMTKECSWQEYV